MGTKKLRAVTTRATDSRTARNKQDREDLPGPTKDTARKRHGGLWDRSHGKREHGARGFKGG